MEVGIVSGSRLNKTGYELIIIEAGDGGIGVHYNILCIFIHIQIFRNRKLKKYVHFDLAFLLLEVYLKDISHTNKIIYIQGYLL